MRSFIAALSAIAVLATAAQALSTRHGGVTRVEGGWTSTVEVTFDAPRDGALSLATSEGSVSVITWSRPRVRVVVTKRVRAADESRAAELLDGFEVRARRAGRRLRLDASARTRECAERVEVVFTVTVPRSFNLDIATGRGSIGLPEVDGAFSAKTADGSIRLDCPTDGLDIEVEDRTGASQPRPSGDLDSGGESDGAPKRAGKGRSL